MSIAPSVLHAIGRTPVVRLRTVVPKGAADVLVKLEFYNPTGSYKDRMALAMIEGAERRGALKPGMRVVEFTGGSTGSSLAMVCGVKGYKLILLSSDAFSEEKLRTMRAFGAELRIVPSEGGKVTPSLFEKFRKEIAVLAAEPGTFWTDQFNNADAIDGYEGIGTELLEQTGGSIDAGVGKSQALNALNRKSEASPIRPITMMPKMIWPVFSKAWLSTIMWPMPDEEPISSATMT